MGRYCAGFDEERSIVVVVVVDCTGAAGVVVDDVSDVVVVVFTGCELQPAIKAVPASSAAMVDIRRLEAGVIGMA
jgi:hypothetical protein